MIRNFFGTGRRKRSVARVFIKFGFGKILINSISGIKYFKSREDLLLSLKPLIIVNLLNKFNVLINVKGGGKIGQINAIQHGISRALINYDIDLKYEFSKLKLLTRDSRIVERKKIGLHKARRSKQFSKR